MLWGRGVVELGLIAEMLWEGFEVLRGVDRRLLRKGLGYFWGRIV
jgi:hypothetical protein